jgi:hypothetical protein
MVAVLAEWHWLWPVCTAESVYVIERDSSFDVSGLRTYFATSSKAIEGLGIFSLENRWFQQDI